MTNHAVRQRPSDPLPADALLSLPVRQLLPLRWQLAASDANYRTTAFARNLGQPPGQVLSWCRRNLNCTTQTLLTHLRMLTVLELLYEASDEEVAVQFGFASKSVLATCFAAYFGVTLKEARRRYAH